MRKSVTQGKGEGDAGRGRVWAWGRAREGVRQGEGEFASAPTAEGAATICTHRIITLSHREMRSTQSSSTWRRRTLLWVPGLRYVHAVPPEELSSLSSGPFA